MARKRSTSKPPLSSLWQPGSKKGSYVIDKHQLEAAIVKSGKSESELVRDVGAAMSDLTKFRAGIGECEYWTAVYLDHCLSCSPEVRVQEPRQNS